MSYSDKQSDPSRFTHLDWAWEEAGANWLYHEHFYGRKAIPLLELGMEKRLSQMTDRAYAAETLHTDLRQSFGNRGWQKRYPEARGIFALVSSSKSRTMG